MKTFEKIGYGTAALCVLGAADAWFNTGAAQWLVDLCLTDPDEMTSDMMPDFMMTNHHVGHALLWLTGAATAVSAALGYEFVEPYITRRSQPGIHRRRLVATLLHMADASGTLRQSVVDAAFLNVTGAPLGPDEAASAYRSCFRRRAPTLAQILDGVDHPDEQRDLLKAATAIWLDHGIDSEAATQRLTDIVSHLGLTDNQVAVLLDPDRATPPPVVSKVARVISSPFTFASRITETRA